MTPSRPEVTGGKGECGYSLLEVVLSLAFSTIAILGVLSAMLGSQSADSEAKELQIALRAAQGKVEEVLAYDYQGNIQGFITHFNQVAYASFTVAGLDRPAPPAQGSPPPQHGQIVLTTTDPNLVGVKTTVSWTSRKGQRSISLLVSVTEVKP